ncbi:MAG TPA: hypothetical protein VFV91_11010 [Gaiellaceae bacterium]|jgi:hypothetical protein|nr:hypothetical protein [Gaiellaceae bacterium]
MRNPLRSEGEAYRFLGVVIVGAAVIIAASFIDKWLGVAVAILAFAWLGRWLMQEPVPGAADPAPVVTSGTPAGTHRVLVVAPPGTESVRVPAGADVLVVVPALASTRESLTGAVDDRRGDAEATAAALEARIPGSRAEVGADDPALAAEDALRLFGADEVLVAGDDGMFEAIRERVALPVSRA